MAKKLISILLVGLMVFSLLPTTFAQDIAVDEIYNAFTQYFVKETSFESITQSTGSSAYDNVGSVTTDLPFVARAYFKNVDNEGNTITPPKDTPVIFYVINHAMERIGTEDDISIVSDLLDEGYIVFTLDYKNNPKAVSPEIDWSLLGARTQIMNKITDYFPGITYSYSKVNFSYVVPAGCRIARNVWYFNLMEHGSVLTEQKIVDSWNGTGSNAFKKYAKKIPAVEKNNYTAGVWYEATCLEDCVKPDGSPIDLDLRMDIIYPSKPKEAPPVFALASSSEARNGSTTHSSRPQFIGFLMRGYAAACYDHEYVPMARTDHYGYYDPYGTANINGVKTHTAAIRCIRQYADDFGYDPSRIGVWGHSKSSYSALLGREHPELLEERIPSEAAGVQPNLTYDHNGEPIPSNVQCVYSSMGDGTKLHKTLVNETTVPSIPACGQKDEFNAYSYYNAMIDTYRNHDVVTLDMDMPDLGHEYPYGIDPILKYDRYVATLDFFDYHLKGNIGAKAVYAYPKDENQEILDTDSVYVKFNASVAREEILNNVKVLDAATGEALTGTWTSELGNTTWTFTTDQFKNAHVYNLVVPTTIKADNGLNLSEGWFTKFKVKGGEKLYPSKDAYIDSASLVNTGSEDAIELSTGTKKGYLEFDISSIESGITSKLTFNVENDAKQMIYVYGLNDNAENWEESTITWENAPANVDGKFFDEEKATLVGKVSVVGKGLYSIDATDYIDSLTGSTARFVLAANSVPGGETLNLQFDTATSAGRNTASSAPNECHSSTYVFRVGGAPVGVSLSTEYDVNGNGKSLFFDRKNSYDRIRFYNAFSTSALSKDDIGRAFDISAWIYPVSNMNIEIGVMNCTGSYSGVFYNEFNTFAVTPNQWNEVTFSCVIDETMANEQVGMLGLQTSGSADDFYIDNVVIKEVATDVTITSKEGYDSENKKFKPVLTIEKGTKATANKSEATYIESGDNASAVFNGGTKLYVNGAESPIIADGNKKGYIKIPVDGANASTKTELVLDVKEGTNNLISVYAIDGGEENILSSSSYPLSSIHTWGENTITWFNAVANDRTDDGILSNFAYGGKEIAKVLVTGKGKYTVDITDYAKMIETAGFSYGTIVLVAERQNDMLGLVESFDAMKDEEFVKDTNSAAYCHSDTYFYRVGGVPGKIFLTDEEDANGDGKSVFVTRPNSYDRIKFYNTFKDSALTEDDIGRTFNLSFKVKPSQATTIKASIMNGSGLNGYEYGGKGYGVTKSQTISADAISGWTTVSFDYTLDATNVAGQIGFLTIETSNNNTNLYIDDIKVVEKGVTDVVLSTKDNATASEVLGYSTTLSEYKANGASTGSTSAEEYSSIYYFRSGGSAPSSKNNWTNAEDHTGDNGGCHMIDYQNPTYVSGSTYDLRAKFYNTVESTRSLTTDDIGRKFKVKFWAKGGVEGINFKYGRMPFTGTTLLDSKTVTNVPTTWTQYEYEFTITETMATADAKSQGTMFSVVRAPYNYNSTYIYNSPLYIDDIEVYEIVEGNIVGSHVQFTGADETVTKKNAIADTFVASGTNQRSNFGDLLTLTVGKEDYKEANAEGIQHAFIKFAKGDYANIKSALLKFNVLESANQTISIYGLTNGSWAQNELNWNNAPALDGNDINLKDVYSNAPVATIEVTSAGEYEIDVTEYVKENKNSDITLVLVADKKAGKKMIDWNFDEDMTFVEDADFRRAGSAKFNSLAVTTDEHYGESGGSLEIKGITVTHSRLKLLNLFQNTPFTSADKGRQFKVSGLIKTNSNAEAYVRVGIMCNYFGTASTEFVSGTQNNLTVPANTWLPFSFVVTVNDALINAKGTVFAVDQGLATTSTLASSVYFDNLVVEEIGTNFGTQVVIDNETNIPSIYVEDPYIAEIVDIDNLSIELKDAVSSGDFKEGDTIELRTTVKAPIDKVVKNVTFYNGDEEIVGKVYKDGYDYVIRIYDAKVGTYNIDADVKFEDGSVETTNAKTFTIKSGASYVVENTTYEGNITNGSTLKVTKTVRNNTASPKTAILVLATYDDSDNLITSSISTSEITIANGEAKDITATITMPQAGEYTVRAFIWDSYKNALPLVKPVTITDLN